MDIKHRKSYAMPPSFSSLRYFLSSIIVTAICFLLGFMWQGWTAIYIISFLALLEVSLSFDNAVVNATVLKGMNKFWQMLFLTVGILIAVVGMRLIFPIVMVAVPTGLGLWETAEIAFYKPTEYHILLSESYTYIAGFGGMFLLMVALNFFFDHERDVFWLGKLERPLAALGNIKGAVHIVALTILFVFYRVIPIDIQHAFLLSGIVGYFLFIFMNSLDKMLSLIFSHSSNSATGATTHAGLAGFLYLELLDASFSLDGVIGAFAVTQDVVIIMLGLAIGAIFVRSFTIWMVEKEVLARYIYIEHGAQYAIFVLGVLMLNSVIIHLPEWFVGSAGATLIILSFYASVRYKRLANRQE